MKKIKEKCLDVLYPPRCPACGGILEDKQRSICPQCESIF
ncbi:double zinc ribbon domain-containing protein, partial [[Clostridium] saccharogumia]|nr:double zinc ribbon domain-containing protein [Thomasclavelia saccharogumia]